MTESELKDEMYQKLLLYSNELEDRIDEINNLNEKISLALESAENRIDKAIEYIENTYIGSILEVHSGYEEEYTKPLLDILKGEDKE